MNELRKILDEFGVSLVEDLQAELLKKGVETNAGQNSRLGNSIRFYYGEKDKTPIFYLSMNDYWEAVDKGRGQEKTPPPINPIVKWLKTKGVDPFKNKKELSLRQQKNKAVKNTLMKAMDKTKRQTLKKVTREKALRSMAFAISKNIGKKGTIKRFNYNGANFFDPVVNDGRITELQNKLSNYLKKEIKIEILNV